MESVGATVIGKRHLQALALIAQRSPKEVIQAILMNDPTPNIELGSGEFYKKNRPTCIVLLND